MSAAILLLSMIVLAGGIRLYFRARHEIDKKKVRDRIENVYLATCRPENNERPAVGDMEAFVSFVPYRSAMEEKERWEMLLEESGNKFWKNPDLKEKHWIHIHVFFFRDGEFVNESLEQFGERVAGAVRLDRAARHAGLKQLSESWYLSEWHGQSVEWRKGA